jgi:arylsulfatase B
MNVSWSDFGTYATDLFTDEAEKVIERHSNVSDGRPLFLYLAHLAVHSGNNYAPLQAGLPNDGTNVLTFTL